jgi:phage N-6-adenine-methyltransferase
MTALAESKLGEITRAIHYHEEQARQAAGLAMEHVVAIGNRLIEARKLFWAEEGGRASGDYRRWALQEFAYQPVSISVRIRVARAVKCQRAVISPGQSLRAVLAMLKKPKELAAPAKLAVHQSSESPEWTTPPEVIQRTEQTLGHIDLDPCAEIAEKPNIPATKHYTATDNGLEQRWEGRVYMNPPYGREIRAWIEKLLQEYTSGQVLEAIALVPARVDTDWFRLLRDCAVCFIDGRLHFSGHADAAPFPSAVVYLGCDIPKFHGAFGDLGDVWVRWDG